MLRSNSQLIEIINALLRGTLKMRSGECTVIKQLTYVAVSVMLVACSRKQVHNDTLSTANLVASSVETFYKVHGRLPSGYAEIKKDLLASSDPNRPFESDNFVWWIEPAPKELAATKNDYQIFCVLEPKDGLPTKVGLTVTLNPPPKAADLPKRPPGFTD